MKKILAGSLVLFTIIPFYLAGAAGSNLVTNGDLELASSGSASIPQAWSQDSWGTLTPVFTYPVAGKVAGSKAAAVQLTAWTSGDAKWMFDHMPVTASTTYQFSDDYSANVVTNVTVEFLMTGGAYNYVWLGDAPATGSNWATFTGSIIPPTGAVSMSVLHTIQSVGTLAIDNVSVTTGTVTPPPPPPVSTSTPPTLPAKPVISSFIATPASIATGSSTTLSWSVSNASSTSINQGVGVVTGTSKVVNPIQTTQYVLTATNPGGSSTATTTVTVTQATSTPPPPPPTNNLVQNGTFETAGNPATKPLGWNSDYWGTITGSFTYPATGKTGRGVRVDVTKYTSGDAKWWFNHIPVTVGTMYQYSENYKSNVITNISVEFKMSNGTYQYVWLANAPSSNNLWSSFTTQVTIPTGAVSMTVLHALVSIGSLSLDDVSVVALPANPFPQGMVTFTFDDGLSSQFKNGRPILNAAGIKAGYYIITTEPDSGDSASMTWANITTLKNEGNEIGGHTRTHPDLTLLTPAQAQTEIKGSYDDLVVHGITPKAFVYPLGGVNIAVEQMVKSAGYTVARGSYWGLNSPASDKVDLFDMRLDKTTTLAQAKQWIDQAYAEKRWLVLEIHDILATGGDDYSITPSMLQSIVTYIKQKGIKAVTLEQGLALMAP